MPKTQVQVKEEERGDKGLLVVVVLMIWFLFGAANQKNHFWDEFGLEPQTGSCPAEAETAVQKNLTAIQNEMLAAGPGEKWDQLQEERTRRIDLASEWHCGPKPCHGFGCY